MRRFGLIVGLSLLLFGCRDASRRMPIVYPVEGRIVLANGQPATSGSVQFYHDVPEQAAGASTETHIRRDGRFQIMLPEGHYRVVVSPVTPFDHGADPLMVQAIPLHYQNPQLTPFTAQIGPSNELLELRLQ